MALVFDLEISGFEKVEAGIIVNLQMQYFVVAKVATLPTMVAMRPDTPIIFFLWFLQKFPTRVSLSFPKKVFVCALKPELWTSFAGKAAFEKRLSIKIVVSNERFIVVN